MNVYRVTNALYARELSGEGARLYGGRWNHIGSPCLYTSSSRALAILEYSVNVSLDRILRNLKVTTIEVPDISVRVMSLSELPGDWREAPAPPSTKDFGTMILDNMQDLIIQIPSTIIPEEFNYLVNPRHGLMPECRVVEVKDFVYDIRIKENLGLLSMS